MEKLNHGLFLTSALLIIVLFLSSLLTKKKEIRRTTKRSQNPTSSPKLPPCPPMLPLIGNLHQLAGSLPWRAFDKLAKIYGPIMHLQLGEICAVVVSSPRLAKEIMRTHDLALADRRVTFATKTLSYNLHDIAFVPYGEHWRQMRKICTSELWSTKKVSSFGSIRAQVVADLIASIHSSLGKPFNLTESTFALSNEITWRAVFGQNFKGRDELMPMLKYQIDSLGKFIVSDLFPSLRLLDVFSVTKHKLQRMLKKVDSVLDNIIRDRKSKRKLSGIEDVEPQEDENLLDVLIRLQQNGSPEFQITDTIIKAIIFEMFAAGSDTSSSIVEWAFSEMLKNPRVMKKAQAEVRLVVGENSEVNQSHCERLDYLKMVIKESLRLHSPAPIMIPRQSREVCVIDGYTIPIQTQVVVNVWAIARDPSVWDDAESFKPERFENNGITFTGNNFEFTPFGAGRRMCPGFSFGIAVVEIELANLLYHFDWKLPEGMGLMDLNMDEVYGIIGRRKSTLYAVPTIRANNLKSTELWD